MLRFALHTWQSAPQGSKELLRRVHADYGFVPSLLAGLAESSGALAAYLSLCRRFEGSSLNPVEQEVVALAASVANDSTFCTGEHAYLARHLTGMPRACLYALLENRRLPDPRLNVLAEFVRELVRQRGRVDGGDLNIMLAAGYGMQHVLDVVMGVALATFASYASHVVRPPLNPEFGGDATLPGTSRH